MIRSGRVGLEGRREKKDKEKRNGSEVKKETFVYLYDVLYDTQNVNVQRSTIKWK